MAEPLFGTAPPIWSAVPFPGPAWFQTPVAGGRPIAEGIVNPQGFAAGLQGAIIGPQGQGALGNGMVSGIPMPGPSFSPCWSARGPSGYGRRRYGNCAGAGGRFETGAAGRADERSGNRGLPLRRARSPAWIERRGVRCDAGRTMLTGTVSQKGLKRDIGEIAWAIPGIKDVQNNITIAPRRRSRAQNRDSEAAAVAGTKARLEPRITRTTRIGFMK